MADILFETVDEKFEADAIFSFDWLAVREQFVSGNVEPVDVLQEISALVKNKNSQFIIIYGFSGSGKTRAVYEFARKQKKNICFFANWNNESIDTLELVESFQSLPSSKKFVILDDVHLNPRLAIQFCLKILNPKTKFILLTRHFKELVEVLKEFRIDAFEALELKSMENIAELISIKNASYLNVEIKQRLLQIADKNPQTLALAHEFIQYKIQENSEFDVTRFFSKINNAENLLQAIYQDIYDQFGAPGIEFISRSVMLQGIHRSHPFCKKTFRSYVQLRNLRYFYVVNDVIYFRPAVLGEFIARNFYFPNGDINPALHELIAASAPDELMRILSLLLLFYKRIRLNAFKTAGALILAGAGIKSLDDNDVARLCIRFYDGFRDGQLIRSSIPDFSSLNLHTSEPEFYNQLAIFYAEIGEYASAARNWEKMLDLAREKNLSGWVIVGYNNLGLVYQKLQDWENALECYRLAHERFGASGGHAGAVQSLVNMAQIYQKIGDMEKAIDHFKKAVRESEHTKDHLRTANLYFNLANLYQRENQLNEAIIHLHSARSSYRKANDAAGSAKICGHLGMIHKARREWETAQEFFKKAIEEAESTNDIRTVAYSYNNLALVYQSQRENESAIEAFKKALEKFQEIDDQQSAFLTLMNLAQIYESQNSLYDAMNYYKQALEIQDYLGDKKRIADIYYHVGEIQIQLEEWQQAVLSYEKGLELVEPETEVMAAKVFANLALAYNQIDIPRQAISFYEKALEKMANLDDIEMTAKTKCQMALSHFKNQDSASAIPLLMEVLFYYLHQKNQPNIREVIETFDMMQKEMPADEFNRLSDEAMNRVMETGISWNGQTILAPDETKKIVEQFKKRRKKRSRK